MPNVNILHPKLRQATTYNYRVRYFSIEGEEKTISVFCRWAKEAKELVENMADCVEVLMPIKRGY